jgi:hypothetical protein
MRFVMVFLPVSIRFSLEHDPFQWYRIMLWILYLIALSDGEPDSTPDQVRGRLSPDNALAVAAMLA